MHCTQRASALAGVITSAPADGSRPTGGVSLTHDGVISGVVAHLISSKNATPYAVCHTLLLSGLVQHPACCLNRWHKNGFATP